MTPVSIRLRLEGGGEPKLLGPMPRYAAEATLHIMARGWVIDGKRVISALIVPMLS